MFPSIATLADGLGLKARMVQYHLARLERVGLWVRHGRTGTTNTYALQLPGLAVAGGGGVQWVAGGGCNGLHPEVTNEVTNTANTAAAVVLPAVVSPFKDSQQQQQIKSEQRIEGQIASCEISCRTIGRPAFDSEWHREKIRSGELTLASLQKLTNDLKAERDDRGRRVRR